MASGFSAFLTDQSWMKVIRALHRSPSALALREIVDLCELSPAGVQDILRRLEEQQIVSAYRQRNKRLFRLTLEEKERGIIKEILVSAERSALAKRAQRLSLDASKKLSWIDDTLLALRKVKETNGDPTQTS